MRKILPLLITFIISLKSFASGSKTYFRADYGIGEYKTDKLNSLNANPGGSTWGAGYGTKMSNVELGLFFRNFNFNKDIVNDGVANKILHNGKSYGVDMNVFLNNHLSLKIGYSFNIIDQKFAIPVSGATLASMKSTYGIQEGYNTSNIFYGAGLNIFAGKKFDTIASIVHIPAGNNNSSTSVQIGLVFYSDSSFADFFGN